ncbi:MAG: histidine phosphatase family protein [Clostridia bacterium]|nr:histidine phosphatase family protein [Clostridia bacterium]
MAEKIFYIVRHALPDFPSGETLCLGRRLDLPLGIEGHAQATQLADDFSSLPVEAIYVSPLLRAQQTAAPIAGENRPLIILDDLAELDGGEWDGLPFCEIRRRWPDFRGSCPPGGERDEHGLSRMQRALEEIDARTERCAVIVAHGGVNRLLLCALAGKPLSEKKQFSQDYAAIGIIEKRGSAFCTVTSGRAPQKKP